MRLHLPSALAALFVLPALTAQGGDVSFNQDETFYHDVTVDGNIRIDHARVEVFSNLTANTDGLTIRTSGDSALDMYGSLNVASGTISLECESGYGRLASGGNLLLSSVTGAGADVTLISQNGSVEVGSYSVSGAGSIRADWNIAVGSDVESGSFKADSTYGTVSLNNVKADSTVSLQGKAVKVEAVEADLSATATAGALSVGFLKGTDKGYSSLRGEQVTLAAFEGGELIVRAQADRAEAEQKGIRITGNLVATDKGISLSSADAAVQFNGVLQAAKTVSVTAETDIVSNYPGAEGRSSAATLTFTAKTGSITIANGIEGQLSAAAENGRVLLADVYLKGQNNLEASLTPLGAEQIIAEGKALITGQQVQICEGLHLLGKSTLVLGGETHVEAVMPAAAAADGKAYISTLSMAQGATVKLRDTAARMVMENYTAPTYLTAKSDTAPGTLTRTGSGEGGYEAESTAFDMRDMLVDTALGNFTLNNKLYSVSGHFTDSAARTADSHIFYIHDLTVEENKDSAFTNTNGVAVSSSLMLENGAALTVSADENGTDGLLTMRSGSTMTIGAGGAALNGNLLLQTGVTLNFGDVLTMGGGAAELQNGVSVFLSDALWQEVAAAGRAVVARNVDSVTLGSGAEPYYVYAGVQGAATRSNYYLAYIAADKTLIVVPEPATVTLSLLALTTLLRRRRPGKNA